MRSTISFALVAAGLALTPLASAATLYIGDDAREGLNVTNGGGTTADGISTLTYVFTGTTTEASVTTSTMYTAAVTQTIRLTEVNFWTANATGTLTPFVAIYDTTQSNRAGSSYTVLSIGSAISVTNIGGGSARQVNAAFLVGGTNPMITLLAGQTLVTGFTQSSQLVYHSNRNTTPGAITPGSVVDYINNEANGVALPASVPNTLQSSDDFPSNNLNGTLRYNVGFVVIPEPSTTGLSALAMTGLALRRRKA